MEKISSALLDMALELGVAIVPVYFSGGLPQEALVEGKLEFPVHQAGQVYHFGRPILASELGAAPYAERRKLVLDGINRLAPESPHTGAPRHELSQEVSLFQHTMGLDEVNATLLNILMRLDKSGLGFDAQAVLDAVDRGVAVVEGARDAAHRAWLERMTQRFIMADS